MTTEWSHVEPVRIRREDRGRVAFVPLHPETAEPKTVTEPALRSQSIGDRIGDDRCESPYNVENKTKDG
jgi:hypothetical protein